MDSQPLTLPSSILFRSGITNFLSHPWLILCELGIILRLSYPCPMIIYSIIFLSPLHASHNEFPSSLSAAPWGDRHSPGWGLGFRMLAYRRKDSVSVPAMLVLHPASKLLSVFRHHDRPRAAKSSAAARHGQV